VLYIKKHLLSSF